MYYDLSFSLARDAAFIEPLGMIRAHLVSGGPLNPYFLRRHGLVC